MQWPAAVELLAADAHLQGAVSIPPVVAKETEKGALDN